MAFKNKYKSPQGSKSLKKSLTNKNTKVSIVAKEEKSGENTYVILENTGRSPKRGSLQYHVYLFLLYIIFRGAFFVFLPYIFVIDTNIWPLYLIPLAGAIYTITRYYQINNKLMNMPLEEYKKSFIVWTRATPRPLNHFDDIDHDPFNHSLRRSRSFSKYDRYLD